MENLNIIYKGAYTNVMYTAFFDGVSWNGNTKIKDQNGNINPQSATPPGSAVFNNWLYIIYKSTVNNDLYIAWFDGTKWNGDIKISSMNGNVNPQSISSPTITVYRGLLYMSYITPASSNLYVAWFDGTTWFGNVPISKQMGGITPQSSINPAIAVYKDILYIVYTGRFFSDLYVAWFDGITWKGNQKISSLPGNISPESKYTPGMGVYNGLLYLAYLGSWLNNIYTCTFDGSTWSGNTQISNQPGGISPASSFNPGLGVFKNKLYLVYVGSTLNNNLYSCTFDGTTWTGNTKINSQPGGIDPESSMNPQVDVTATIPGTQSNWLSKLPDGILLGDINLPGTHDSAAINSSISTPYACHNNSITKQLQYGIRILDVRLKINMNSNSSFSFMTCHGDFGPNEYQTFPSLMDECKNFLTANPQELIVMTLKVDDWSNSVNNKPQAYAALKTLLGNYPITVQTAMPNLGSVRGKIFLYNRMNNDLSFGVPISVPDNTDGAFITIANNGAYTFYLQDRYKGLPLIGSQKAKYNLVIAAFTKKTAGMVVLNFASATWYGVYGVYIMGDLLNYFGQNAAAQRYRNFGWIMLDYAFNNYNTNTYSNLNVVTIIISSNFNYSGYPDTFKVVSDGKDEL